MNILGLQERKLTDTGWLNVNGHYLASEQPSLTVGLFYIARNARMIFG